MSSNIKRYGDSGVNTVEGNVAGSRAARLSKQREKEKQDYESQRQAIEHEHAKAGALRAFQGHSDHLEEEFKRQTVGLVTNDEFKRRRIELQKEDVKELEGATSEKKQKPKKRKKKVALSFEDEDEEESPEMFNGDQSESNGVKVARVSKDPDVETDFLPDSERELQLQRERERLREEWKRDQEEIKKELLSVTYSYWDGSGHRREVTVSKGSTILKFLDKVRQELSKEFPELRGVSAENLMYIKEDLIIPHHYTFYDLIITKARGKSGPLFHFDVHDDVRLIHDARVEKDESHPGKITERRWYERNKHIFPASRWEVYDPAVQRGKYTIHGE